MLETGMPNFFDISSYEQPSGDIYKSSIKRRLRSGKAANARSKACWRSIFAKMSAAVSASSESCSIGREDRKWVYDFLRATVATHAVRLDRFRTSSRRWYNSK